MHKSLFCLLCIFQLLALVHGDIYADLFALRMNGTNVGSIISIDFESGFKTIADINSLTNFTSPNNLTTYDSNSEIFVVGNADPPMLALINTFTKQTKVISLPLYGQLVALTTYDGIVYALLGLDEDLPTIGSIVGYDLNTGDSNRLSKFKINPNQSFIHGSTLTWLPHKQVWIFDLLEPMGNTSLYLVNTDPKAAVVIPTYFPGGWESTWFDVNTDNQTVIAYKSGQVALLDLGEFVMRTLYSYSCSGILTVDFQKQQFYHLSNCDSPLIEIYSWYYNKSQPPVDLDPQLEDINSLQSVGTYIPFLCGTPCDTHPDCALARTCNTCRLGRCSTSNGDCNAFCLTANDCFAGVCVFNCENNRCGKRGCGTKCTNHDDCVNNSQECTICRLGSCVSTGGCGAYCLTNLDCYEGDCVGVCSNWRCSTPM